MLVAMIGTVLLFVYIVRNRNNNRRECLPAPLPSRANPTPLRAGMRAGIGTGGHASARFEPSGAK